MRSKWVDFTSGRKCVTGNGLGDGDFIPEADSRPRTFKGNLSKLVNKVKLRSCMLMTSGYVTLKERFS